MLIVLLFRLGVVELHDRALNLFIVLLYLSLSIYIYIYIYIYI